MARVLNDIFVGGAQAGALDSANNQIAPGSGAVASSSGDQPATLGGQSPFGSQTGSSRVRQQLGVAPPDQRGGLGSGLGSQASSGGSGNGGFAAAPLDARGGANSGPLLSNVRITADVSSNSLLIYASNENYQLILRTLSQPDRPQLQVAIDATVAEVKLNDSLSYGV